MCPVDQYGIFLTSLSCGELWKKTAESQQRKHIRIDADSPRHHRQHGVSEGDVQGKFKFLARFFPLASSSPLFVDQRMSVFVAPEWNPLGADAWLGLRWVSGRRMCRLKQRRPQEAAERPARGLPLGLLAEDCFDALAAT